MAVSILLAAYNNGKYIGQLIDSILTQSFGDFTLYIRDDCSDDDTMAVVLSYADKRIKIIPNDRPSGSAQNNFFALLLGCDDDYIMFADADDMWLPDKVERTLELMKRAEQEHGTHRPVLVHTDLTVVNEKLETIADSMFRYEKLSPKRTGLGQLLVQNNVTGCTAMINRALRRMVEQQPGISVMHDWWLALVASAFGAVAVLDKPTILYRQHGANQVGAYDAGNLAAAAKKLSRRRAMREIYALMYAQAGCFADTFSQQLSERQLVICRAFESMKDKGKIGRISTIVRHKFYKNTLLRNIGQIITV